MTPYSMLALVYCFYLCRSVYRSADLLTLRHAVPTFRRSLFWQGCQLAIRSEKAVAGLLWAAVGAQNLALNGAMFIRIFWATF